MPPDKPLLSVSPSQTKTAHTCPTKWWASKRLGLRDPSTPATRFGQILHAVVECYLLQIPEDKQFAYCVDALKKERDEPPTKQEVGRAWGLVNHNIKLGLLPTPGTGKVEGTIQYTIDGAPTAMNARFDFLDKVRHPVTNKWCPLVVDQKTTSSPNWAETEESLRDNDQALIYGEYGLRQMPDADYVCVRFIYYQTKDRKHGWQVEIWLTRNEVNQKYKKLVEYIAQMCEWYNEDDINKIPREVSSSTCHAFNRDCAAKGVCPAYTNKQSAPGNNAARLLQVAQNMAVTAPPPTKERSTMSASVVNNPKQTPTFHALITKRYEKLGLNEAQSKVMLAEYDSKSGWTLDPVVQSAALPAHAVEKGAEIIRKRAATKATVARDVAAVVEPALPRAARQLTADELELVEQLKSYNFPADEATAIVRRNATEAQEILDAAEYYDEWAERNEQPDLSEEREEVVAPAPKAAPAPKPAAKATLVAPPAPPAAPATKADMPLRHVDVASMVAAADQANPTAIKKFRTTLARLDVELEAGLSALIEAHGGKTLSEDEASEAIKEAFSLTRIRAEHSNAVALCLGLTGDVFVIPGGLSPAREAAVAFDAVAYLRATWPALANDAAALEAVDGLSTAEAVTKAIRALSAKPATPTAAAPPLRARTEAAALVSGGEEAEVPAPAPAAKAQPTPAAPVQAAPVQVEPPASPASGPIVLVDALVCREVGSLDEIFESFVTDYVTANGKHPLNTPYREGMSAVTQAFRAYVNDMLAASGPEFFIVDSRGDAYRALNGAFGAATVVYGRR